MSIAPGTLVFKDPQAEKVYTFDWSSWLVGAATLASHTIAITCVSEASPVLTYDNDAIVNTSTGVKVRLLAGTVGKTYRVTCHVVTNESPTQTDDKSIFVKVQQE